MNHIINLIGLGGSVICVVWCSGFLGPTDPVNNESIVHILFIWCVVETLKFLIGI